MTRTRMILAAPPLLVGREQAAAICGVSASTWDRLCACGAIGPRQISLGGGGRKLWRVDDLRDWVSAGCPGRVRWENRLDDDRRLRVAGG